MDLKYEDYVPSTTKPPPTAEELKQQEMDKAFSALPEDMGDNFEAEIRRQQGSVRQAAPQVGTAPAGVEPDAAVARASNGESASPRLAVSEIPAPAAVPELSAGAPPLAPSAETQELSVAEPDVVAPELPLKVPVSAPGAESQAEAWQVSRAEEQAEAQAETRAREVEVADEKHKSGNEYLAYLKLLQLPVTARRTGAAQPPILALPLRRVLLPRA